MPTSNELRVFISSTFRDLQEEREHLVKKVFPEIRAVCRQRGVTFTEIDLRWGLTDEQAALGTVIRTCLEEVDKCRPYFIGLIGSRYGWVPELHEVLMDPELLAKYPFVEELAIEGASVTEMEFVHGVLNAADRQGSFFYHRQENDTEAERPEQVRSLVERARSSGHRVREFAEIEHLGRFVREDLLELIDRSWPAEEAPSELELERRAHAAFAASRVRAYIPQPAALSEFSLWITEGTTPLVVHGESGLGKSSLVAYLAEYFRRKHPSALVVEHYVGASDRGGTSDAVMRHLLAELRERFSIDEPIPDTHEELQSKLPNWLFRVERIASEHGVAVLLVIDAVNQLDEVGRRMSWLPKTVPAGIRLLVSTTGGETGERLGQREWSRLDVVPLSDERVRESIVVRYLGEFRKGISPEHLRRISSDPKGASPLYLRVVAEEMRLHGQHETLEEVIARFRAADDLPGVFDLVLQRMESDFGATVVDLFRLLAVSRSGLSESEILEIAGCSRLELSRMLFALDYNLLHRDGLLGFFHDHLVKAVRRRYLQQEDARRESAERLSAHFHASVDAAIAAGVAVSPREVLEACAAFEQLGSDDRVASMLSQLEVLMALTDGESRYDVVRYWSRLRDRFDVCGLCNAALKRWLATGQESSRHIHALQCVGDLMQHLGLYDEADGYHGERIQLARRIGDRTAEALARSTRGDLLRMRARYDDAIEEITYALRLLSELGDRPGEARALNALGNVYWSRGENDRALECYVGQEEIVRQLGDRSGIADAVAHIGLIHVAHDEMDQALDCFRRAAATIEEVGDRLRLGALLNNIALIHSRRKEFDEAMTLLQRREQISTELGDDWGVASSAGNMGSIHRELGHYGEALRCFERQESICRAIGVPKGQAVAIGNMGIVYADLGRYEQALECGRTQIEMYVTMGDERGVAFGRTTLSRSLIALGLVDEALACCRAAIDGHRACGSRSWLATTLSTAAGLLLDLCERDEEPPEGLREFHPSLAVDDWRPAAFQHARGMVDEALRTAEEIGDAEAAGNARNLLARFGADVA